MITRDNLLLEKASRFYLGESKNAIENGNDLGMKRSCLDKDEGRIWQFFFLFFFIWVIRWHMVFDC